MLIPAVFPRRLPFHHYSNTMDKKDTEESKRETGNRGRRKGRKQKGNKRTWEEGKYGRKEERKELPTDTQVDI